MTKRVVFDTNILISGYLWGGIPRKALEKTRTTEWILVLSEDGIKELVEKGILKEERAIPVLIYITTSSVRQHGHVVPTKWGIAWWIPVIVVVVS